MKAVTFSSASCVAEPARASRRKNLPPAIRRAFPGVRRVVDSKRTVEVSVSARDCGRGAKPGDYSLYAVYRSRRLGVARKDTRWGNRDGSRRTDRRIVHKSTVGVRSLQ